METVKRMRKGMRKRMRMGMRMGMRNGRGERGGETAWRGRELFNRLLSCDRVRLWGLLGPSEAIFDNYLPRLLCTIRKRYHIFWRPSWADQEPSSS